MCSFDKCLQDGYTAKVQIFYPFWKAISCSFFCVAMFFFNLCENRQKMGPQLNLPAFNVQTRIFEGQTQIFDSIRRKYVALTPEEWVRQHFINFLVTDRGYSAGLLAIEHQVDVSGMLQRADIVAHNRTGSPIMVVECKATNVEIGNSTFFQAARYNLSLKADYLAITNGLKHYCCKVDLESKQFEFLQEIPHFDTIG